MTATLVSGLVVILAVAGLHVSAAGAQQYDPSNDFGTLASSSTFPYGIWSDGTTMWVADFESGKIYAYNMASKLRDPSNDFNNTLMDAGNTDPTGIWSNGTTMRVADYLGNKIYAYKMSDRTHDSSKDFDTLLSLDRIQPTGIWSDGTTMWVVSQSDNNVIAYNMAGKSRDPSKDFNGTVMMASGNTNPNGIWSDGATMWVADNGRDHDKIYAYKMSDKSRDPSKDFNNTLMDAGNTDPTGIWSDGATMWVVDYKDYRIYAYRMPGAPSPSGSGTSGSSASYPPPDPLVAESATYYSTVGLFVVSFNETVDADRTMHGRLSVLGEVRNHTFTAVMDGSMYRTGADPLTLVYRPGQGGVDAIHIMESPRLRAESANGTLSIPIPVDVGDTYPPALEWVAYSAETGTLALAFNETLDGATRGAPLYAYGEGQAGAVALGYNATVHGGLVRLALDQDSRAALDGMARPHVVVETGTVRDLAGNAVPQIREPITVQSTVPLPVSASYDPDLGIIVLSLDGATDILAVDTSRVHIREYGRDGGVTMQHVDWGPDNTMIFRLDGGQRGAVGKMASPHLYMDAGAVHGHTDDSPAVSGIPVVSGAGAPARAAYNVDSGVLAVAFGGGDAGADVTLIVGDAGGSGGIPFHMADAERVSGGVASYRLDGPYRDVLAGAEDARLHIGDGAVAGKAWSRTPDTVVPVEVRPGLSVRPDTGLDGERRTQVAYFTGTVPDGPVLGYFTLAVSCDGAASVLRMDLVLPANDVQDMYAIFAGSVRAGAVPLDHPRYMSDAVGLVVDLAPGLGGDGGLELQPHVSVTIPIVVLDGRDGGDSLAALHVEYEAPLDVICTIGPALTGSHRVAFVDDTAGVDEVESATLLAVQDFNGYVARLGQPWRLALDTYEAHDGYAALTAVRSLNSPTAVLGPSGNATLWAVLYQTSGDRMLLISCCSDSPEIAIPDHVFRMEPVDAGQAAALGALAADGADHIIVVYRHDKDGMVLRDAATGQIPHGDARVSWIAHSNDAESAAAILEAVRHGEATAAVLLYPEAAGTIRAAAAPHVVWYGVDAILDEPDLPEGTTAVRPGHHIGGTLSDRLDIPSEGEPAARVHRAYDAVLALGAAMLAAQSVDTAALVQSLPRISGAAPDILGTVSFDHNGDLVVPGYTVWRVTGGSWTATGQTVPGTAE